MKKPLFYLLVFLGILILPLSSAAHYIVGYVQDAKDGTSANGHSVVLWNPLIGMQENLTDIIGQEGNSMTDNIYMIDCELLPNGCNIGTILNVKVFDNGDNYLSPYQNISVSGSGYDLVDNLSINSPPNVSLIFPIMNSAFSSPEIVFNCSAFDFDGNMKEISLYGNWTGQWELNETKTMNSSEEFKTFAKTLPEGIYNYSCNATDELYVSSYPLEEEIFTIDLTNPSITSVYANITSLCGTTSLARINCTTSDALSGIKQVLIQASYASGKINYSTSILTGNTYYAEIPLNETGTWDFTCFSEDNAGNMNSAKSPETVVHSNLPELFVNSSYITLGNPNPIENQSVKINTKIENTGCSDATNVVVGFFMGDPSLGQSLGETIINISAISSITSNISWNAQIGPNNIFIFADDNLAIAENNESNNQANKTFSINAWQEVYGNTSIDKIIGENYSISIGKWFSENSTIGSVFITDSECSINWLSLQAIGKTKAGTDSSDDFLEIDELLNMTSFSDSVSNIFSNNQVPKQTESMLIHQNEITGVPVVKSTNNSDFLTGILWDTSDDSNGEYDYSDKEDLVFATEVNKSARGEYGTYDYEIKIPSRLRQYYSTDTREVYLYYDLN